MVDPVGSSQLIDCEVYRVIENYQRNETLLFKIKTMISSHYFDVISKIDHTKIILQDSFHYNYVHYSHQKYFSSVNSFKQFYCTYNDWIIDWLEDSYLNNFQNKRKFLLTLFPIENI